MWTEVERKMKNEVIPEIRSFVSSVSSTVSPALRVCDYKLLRYEWSVSAVICSACTLHIPLVLNPLTHFSFGFLVHLAAGTCVVKILIELLFSLSLIAIAFGFFSNRTTNRTKHFLIDRFLHRFANAWNNISTSCGRKKNLPKLKIIYCCLVYLHKAVADFWIGRIHNHENIIHPSQWLSLHSSILIACTLRITHCAECDRCSANQNSAQFVCTQNDNKNGGDKKKRKNKCPTANNGTNI